MRDITSELKELRLHGMASVWADLTDSGTSSTESSKWLIEHLLQAEHTDRAMRSVRHPGEQQRDFRYQFRRNSLDETGYIEETSYFGENAAGSLLRTRDNPG